MELNRCGLVTFVMENDGVGLHDSANRHFLTGGGHSKAENQWSLDLMVESGS